MTSDSLVTAWAPYKPTDSAPWTLRRVVHLHRRAGFAAPWQVLQQDLRDGPDAAISRVLAGKVNAATTPRDFESLAGTIGDAAVASDNPARLKAWWVYRMLVAPDPLAERLTLMWHNHFATSNRKVQNLALMREQNELFRRHARGNFADLLSSVVKHPAVLLWLDADSNRKGHPNENLARELMELFTLGVGHYTEEDVKEAARALTGWMVKNRQFRESAAYHDDGEKAILGRGGAWSGDDLVAILVDEPATSVRLARRLCELLMGEGAAEEQAIAELAAGLRERKLNVGWAVQTVLRSAAFFAEGSIGNRVLAPVEYVVGSVRALEIVEPPPSTMVLAEWMAAMGQDLFEPPNVFGWAGGRSWINSRSLIARSNFAQRLADGSLLSTAGRADWLALAERCGCGDNADDFSRFLGQTLWIGRSDEEAKRVKQTVLGEETSLSPDGSRRLVATMLGSAQAQLG
ncbi:MAG TPA: DUF1800 domain-containing protein [Pirellulales bacterium]|jgi:uncharacterized protein (DUF1800 family)|nr:DUF1800 domain-containing protein [Pirellulales bacterium]